MCVIFVVFAEFGERINTISFRMYDNDIATAQNVTIAFLRNN